MTTDDTSASGEQPGPLNRQQLVAWQLAEVQALGHIGTWEFHPPSGKLVWSAETCRIMGVGKRGFDGSIETFLSLVHPDDRATVLAVIRDTRRQPSRIELEHRIVRPDGTAHHVRVHGMPCLDETGTLMLAGTVHDVTQLRQSTAALEAMSRTLLRTLEAVADAFYTLDRQWRFTYLNQAAERLLRRSRHELLGKVLWDAYPDLVGTHFGAQFQFAMERRQPVAFEEYYAPLQAWKDVRIFPTEEGLATYTTEITERKRLQEIEREMTERFRMVAKVTSDIIRDWEVPMDRLWWNEGVQSVFGYSADVFNDGIKDWTSRIAAEDRERVVSGLYAAMNGGQESWCAEYRFLREDGSYVTVRDQGVFMRNAEETGLILQLGEWVLDAACRQLVYTIETMHALKENGIGFSLDDFGTGYSSLAYLKRLPLDQLKIDQSFVRDVLTDANDAAIARTILGLGHSLGLEVIAEGVETADQRNFLAMHGCAAFQGYLFGQPVAAEQF